MANTYTAITTPVTATTISVSTFGSLVSGDVDYLAVSKPNCRVYNSANIAITTATLTALTFDSERYDKGAGSHSTSVNTGRLTVPTSCGGVYMIFGHVSFASNNTGSRIIAIRLNGATYIARVYAPATQSADTEMSISTCYNLAAADYVELVVYQNSGGNLNAQVVANYACEFGWVWQST